MKSELTLDEYQIKASVTYLGFGSNYLTLGLLSEAGEVAGVAKRLIRDDIDDVEYKQRICSELGDTLWYLSQLAHVLGISLSEIAEHNLVKVLDRQKRSTIKGTGDDR